MRACVTEAGKEAGEPGKSNIIKRKCATHFKEEDVVKCQKLVQIKEEEQ